MGALDGFFAVDNRTWLRVCQLGINLAVAYLVLARGSGGDNRTTAWSVNAIETNTGIGRPRAQKAIAILKSSGLVREDQGGTRPRYSILGAHEVAGCEGGPQPLDADEERIFALIGADSVWVPKVGRYDNVWKGGNPYAVARGLVRKGVVQHLGGQNFKRADGQRASPELPNWIWLPNAIIDGASDEAAPVELLRQTQNCTALRLFVDLYNSHALAADGGIHWRRMRLDFSRHKVGERGAFTVWGFKSAQQAVWGDAPFLQPHLTGQMEAIETPDGSRATRDRGYQTFWDAVLTLQGLGLLEWVGHVIEADCEDAEIIHPYAVGNGEPNERALAVAAHNAAQTMLTDAQVNWADGNGLWLLPMATHQLPNVQMVGIPRLRYRPRTKATGAWFLKQSEWAKFIERYRALECGSERTSDEESRHATSR